MQVLLSIRLNRQSPMAGTLRLGSLQGDAWRGCRSPTTKFRTVATPFDTAPMHEPVRTG